MTGPWLRAALVIAAAVVLGAFVVGGIYTATSSENGVFVVNKFTGHPWVCARDACYDFPTKPMP